MTMSSEDAPVDLDRDALVQVNRELQERVSGLAAIHRITLAMASARKPAELLRLCVEETVELLRARDGVVYLIDAAGQRLVPRVAVGVECDRFPTLSLENDEDLIVEASQSRYHRVLRAVERIPAEGRDTELLRLAVPLIAEGRCLGVVSLRRAATAELSAIEEEMLWLLAGHASQILASTRLYEEIDQSYRELSLLYEVQQEMVSAVGYQSVLRQIVHKLKDLFKAQDCTIRLLDRSGGDPMMRIAASVGRRPLDYVDRPLSQSKIDQQVMSGGVVAIRDLQSDPRYLHKETARERGYTSMISAPLRARDTIIGTIRIYTAEPRDFTVDDQKLLAAVAAQAAVAIENAELYRQLEAKNRELHESYERLRQTQQALVMKEKLALLGEMAATVAHEIRNPLTAVRGFAQRIARKVGGERVCTYCQYIVEEVDRLDHVIEDVLDFARRLSPTLEPTDLNVLVRDTVRLLQEELVKNNITVVPSLDTSLPPVALDATQIKQVLVNLIQNARQAMQTEGTLTLVTERQDPWAMLSVSDTGPGIAADHLAQIWEPFYTTRTHGTGLGLALVRRIVEDHGGQIEVDSRVGEGATFRVFLPLGSMADAPAARGRAPDSG